MGVDLLLQVGRLPFVWAAPKTGAVRGHQHRTLTTETGEVICIYPSFDFSYNAFLFLTAACAAASRAIGTLNGEQET